VNETEHIDRLRAFAHWFAMNGGHMTEECKDALTLLADYDALKAQLPEGMKNCTILFKECEKGHGWLTATNWVQHPCPTCERDELKARLAQCETDLALTAEIATRNRDEAHAVSDRLVATEARLANRTAELVAVQERLVEAEATAMAATLLRQGVSLMLADTEARLAEAMGALEHHRVHIDSVDCWCKPYVTNYSTSHNDARAARTDGAVGDKP
jgi:hypothetical protein